MELDEENDEEEDIEGQPSRQSRYSDLQKQLTQKRLVHDIGSCLDKKNFQNMTKINKDRNFGKANWLFGTKNLQKYKEIHFCYRTAHTYWQEKEI